MTVIAVAGQSVRLLAQAAAQDGFDVVALDVFGDVDTCAVASHWIGIGSPSPPRIDGERLLSALAELKRQGEVSGWVAGSGLEGQPALLAQGAALLPLWGTEPAAVARVRDPATFFDVLAAHDIEHPPWSRQAPADPDGWLSKDAQACGGWHVREASDPADVAPGVHGYFQRRVSGHAMSATFLGNGRDAIVLGFNRQLVGRIGARPYVFCGVVGPVPVPDEVARQVRRAVSILTDAFGLRGLASLDFMLDGIRCSVLEVNPRPTASLAAYRAWRPLAAHVHACRQGRMPRSPPPDGAVTGCEIVFARQPMHLTPAGARWLSEAADVHDLPRAGQQFAAEDPVCSVGAQGATEADVLARLRQRRIDLLNSLEERP